MNNNFKILNTWLSSLKLKHQKELKLEDIHIDQLLQNSLFNTEKKDKKMLFFKSLEVFHDLIHLNFGYNLHKDYIPSLVFSLECTNAISLGLTHSNVWEEFDDTPPDIHLVPKKYFLISGDYERYRKPLDLDFFKQFQDDCVVYYSCFRKAEDIRNNWEYARSIHIDNFGKNNVSNK